jgi:hypothetical protein
MSEPGRVAVRKVSGGLTRSALTYTVTVRGFRSAGRSTGASTGTATVGRLAVPLPALLLNLLGWRVGQRLKVQALAHGLALAERRVSSATRAVMPRKQSGADRVRWRRRWQRALRSLRRHPRQRRQVTSRGRA